MLNCLDCLSLKGNNQLTGSFTRMTSSNPFANLAELIRLVLSKRAHYEAGILGVAEPQLSSHSFQVHPLVLQGATDRPRLAYRQGQAVVHIGNKPHVCPPCQIMEWGGGGSERLLANAQARMQTSTDICRGRNRPPPAHVISDLSAHIHATCTHATHTFSNTAKMHSDTQTCTPIDTYSNRHRVAHTLTDAEDTHAPSDILRYTSTMRTHAILSTLTQISTLNALYYRQALLPGLWLTCPLLVVYKHLPRDMQRWESSP